MTLRNNYIFSQSSLQSYLDCPRKFELRYIKNIEWPSLYCEPFSNFEKEIELGQSFHQMVHRQILGIPACPSDQADILDQWITSFTDHNPLSNYSYNTFPEFSLTDIFNGYRLIAKFDALAFGPNKKITIFDWKTSRKKPSTRSLYNRVQTRVYPMVLVKAGSILNAGQSILPEAISMVYWFPEFPTEPEVIQYSRDQYQKDTIFIKNIIDEICESSESRFPLTRDEKKCLYCNYRSLCDRGVSAGNFDGSEYSEAPEDDRISDEILDDLIQEIFS